MTRSEIARAANECSHGRCHAISEASTVRELERWLQWCDPNGCHLAELAANEEIEPYTLDDAWSAIATMLEG